MRPRRITITGGAGFIGSHLAERLLKDGHSITVIDDLSTGCLANLNEIKEHQRLRVIQSKVSTCSEFATLARESHTIVHLAAAVGVDLVVKSPIDTIQTNLEEARAVLVAANEHQVPVLLASSSEVYGKSPKAEFAETDDLLIGQPKLGRWSYACSKLMDEFMAMAYAQQHRLPVTILRFFNTVGPRQTGRYGMALPRFIESAIQGAPLRVFGSGQQTRCFCFVLDAVEAIVRLMNSAKARGEIFNIGSTEEISILKLAEKVIQLTDSASKIEFIPYEKAYRSGFEDMMRRKPVVSKLFQTIGYRPETKLDEIIHSTVAFIKTELKGLPGPSAG